jgi:GntR family transcriptional regulator
VDALRPGYRQVAARLREQILAGTPAPGEAIAPHSALARDLQVSQATVSAAVSQLAAEGLVRLEHGKQTIVLAQRRWRVSVAVPWRGGETVAREASEGAREALSAAAEADPAVRVAAAAVTLTPSGPGWAGGWALVTEADLLASDPAVAVARAWSMASGALRGQSGWDLGEPDVRARPA